MTEPPQVAHSTDDHAVGALPRSTAKARGRSARARSSPDTRKFRLALAGLAGIAVIAVVVAISVAGGDHSTKIAQPWSSWSPPDSGTLAARDIADHVAPFYRMSAVDQLAVVTVVNLESATQAAATAQAQANGSSATSAGGLQVAVRPSPTSSAVSLLSGNTIAYNLCGIGGKNCAIGAGTPSTDRLLLLRREALELALYTFKYVGNVENVVAILPPGRTDETGTLSKRLPTSNAPASKPVDIAVLFVRQEVQPLLDQPLGDTLPEEFPPTVSQMAKAPEAGLVDQLTARGLFSEQLQQAQDGSDLIVLNPLPPQ